MSLIMTSIQSFNKIKFMFYFFLYKYYFILYSANHLKNYYNLTQKNVYTKCLKLAINTHVIQNRIILKI